MYRTTSYAVVLNMDIDEWLWRLVWRIGMETGETRWCGKVESMGVVGEVIWMNMGRME